MKSAKYLAAGLLVAMVLGTAAYADSGATRFSIPFNFYVGTSILPAGDYSIWMVTQRTLKVESTDAKTSAMIEVNPVEDPLASGRARIVFHRYGDTNFCSQVWAPTRAQGHELFASGLEIQLARQMKQVPVTILASK